MPLYEVREQVEKVRQRIVRLNTQQEYSATEIATRNYCIDPNLTALGWKLDDPSQVRYEAWRWGRVDYELHVSSEVVTLLEAKSLGRLWPDRRYAGMRMSKSSRRADEGLCMVQDSRAGGAIRRRQLVYSRPDR